MVVWEEHHPIWSLVNGAWQRVRLVGLSFSDSMSSAYSQLLDATIAHLENLKGRGVSWVPVRRETLLSMGSAPLKGASQPRPLDVGRTVPPVISEATRPTVPSERSTASSPRDSVVPTAVRSEAALSRWSMAAVGKPSVSANSKSSSASVALPAPLSPEARASAMAELQAQVLGCSRCSHLVASRHSVVFGIGDIQSRILFVGEAPGVEEDLSGQPFVGPAGDLFSKILTAMGLSRDSVYIANLLKCRPDTPGEATGNRKPRPEEMASCFPWLDRQIDLVHPQVLVALGASAVQGLLGKGTAAITQLRGSWQNYRGIPLMPTYHPAYLLQNQALSEKRKVWEDMLQVLERAGYPITSKQRGFFLARD